MKTNNNPTSGKRLAQLLALCLLATFSSCDRDGTESVEFGVNVQTPDAVYAGQPVTFEFDGNPDYIAFYSGEKNDRYANRDRTTLPEVDSLGLSYSAKMQYAENYDYLGDRILRVMISDTYDGSGEINPEEWHDLTEPRIRLSMKNNPEKCYLGNQYHSQTAVCRCQSQPIQR